MPLLHAILPAAFEGIFGVLAILPLLVNSWDDICILIAAPLIGLALSRTGTLINMRVGQSSSPSKVDKSYFFATLSQKSEILPSVVSEAAYEAAVHTLHSLPHRIRSWQDLVESSGILVRSLHLFVLLALEKYLIWLRARDLPTSVPLHEEYDSQAAAMFYGAEAIILEALNSVPHEIPHRLDMINMALSIRQSGHLFLPHVYNLHALASWPSKMRAFFCRSCQVLFSPSKLTVIFLESTTVFYSLWRRSQSGPEVVLPMSSLAKWPSSYLSRLLVHYCRDLPQHEFGADISPLVGSRPSTVAVIDLNAVSPEGRYSTAADLYGHATLYFLPLIINVLLRSLWTTLFFLPNIAVLWLGISMFGDGTIALLPRSDAHHRSSPAYMLLLDEEFSVVLRGSRDVMESIATGGFRFVYPAANTLEPLALKILAYLMLEGYFEGLRYLMVILPMWRFFNPSFTSPSSQIIGLLVLFVLFMVILPIRHLLRVLLALCYGHDLPESIAQAYVKVSVDGMKSIGRAIPLVVSWLLYIHDHAVVNELQLLVDLIPTLITGLTMMVPIRRYPIRTAKFLKILGNPPVKKWRFRTPAAAATFQCLVLCHGVQRPVRHIDVRGVLDTLIPDQRHVWRAWKARVADRIAHEEEILFAPTLPTFRDAAQQRKLVALFGEAQYAYDAYRDLFSGFINEQLFLDSRDRAAEQLHSELRVDAEACHGHVPSADLTLFMTGLHRILADPVPFLRK